MTADETPDDRLDRAFMALADPVRRAIVARLSRGPATVRAPTGGCSSSGTDGSTPSSSSCRPPTGRPDRRTPREHPAQPRHDHRPEGLPFVEIVREFESPAALVFRAHEDPELVKDRLGPHGYAMEIDQWDLRTGRSAFPSVEARDGILEAGMEVGVREGFERLDGLLADRG